MTTISGDPHETYLLIALLWCPQLRDQAPFEDPAGFQTPGVTNPYGNLNRSKKELDREREQHVGYIQMVAKSTGAYIDLIRRLDLFDELELNELVEAPTDFAASNHKVTWAISRKLLINHTSNREAKQLMGDPFVFDKDLRIRLKNQR